MALQCRFHCTQMYASLCPLLSSYIHNLIWDRQKRSNDNDHVSLCIVNAMSYLVWMHHVNVIRFILQPEIVINAYFHGKKSHY